jgi:hypothetical protein
LVSIAAQEWKAQGVAEGKVIGAAEARRADLLDILEARFGMVEDAVRVRVAGLSPETLQPLLRRAATAPSIDAVFDTARH